MKAQVVQFSSQFFASLSLPVVKLTIISHMWSAGLYIQDKVIVSFKTVAIDVPGGKRSFVKMILAQTTILNRAI